MTDEPEQEAAAEQPPEDSEDTTPVTAAFVVIRVKDPLAVMVGDLESDCEMYLAHPCTKKSRQPARFMVDWADCNCDEPDPAQAYCLGCIKEQDRLLRDEEVVTCGGCGLVFRPSHTIIKAVIPLDC